MTLGFASAPGAGIESVKNRIVVASLRRPSVSTPGTRERSLPSELEPGYPTENDRVMRDPGEIGYFHERCSDFMRELLAELAACPEEPRPFPEVEDEIGWPHRRIASVLGGVSHLRHAEFGGRRPYHFLAPRFAFSQRWEIWMDAEQARAVNDTRAADRLA